MDHLFETERLLVRKFKEEDAERLFEIHLETAVKKWFPNESYADRKETNGAIAFYMGCVDKGRLPYVLAVEEKTTGELIGDTGINLSDKSQAEVEIGYVISERYYGKGYATELVNAMTDFVRITFDIRVLYGRVLKGNHASARVLEKNGYCFVKEEYGAEDDPYGDGMLVYRKEC